MDNEDKSVNKRKKRGVFSSVLGSDMISETHTVIKDMAKSAISPKKIIENAKNETYDEAINRLQVDDIEVYKVYKNNVILLYFSLFFTIICFLGCLSSLFISKNIMIATSFLAIMLICLANSFRFSFRSYQIRNKKLCDVREWWDNASEWFPRI